jgi:hypothetical protein
MHAMKARTGFHAYRIVSVFSLRILYLPKLFLCKNNKILSLQPLPEVSKEALCPFPPYNLVGVSPESEGFIDGSIKVVIKVPVPG